MSLTILLLVLGLALSSSALSFLCPEVTLEGAEYDSSAGKSVFTYHLSHGAGCEPLTSFELLDNCTLFDCLLKAPSGRGWSFPFPLGPGEERDYHIVLPGDYTNSKPGEYEVVVGGSPSTGSVDVPNCDEPSDPQATCPIQFSVEELTLTPGQSVDIQVILGGDPEGDVTVILESNCAFLSECTLAFNSGNFAVPQTVTVTAGDFNLATVCFITAVTEGAVCAGDQVQINQPQEPNGPGGMIYGDPHVVTFSNTRYQIPDVGVYTLVQASNGQFIAQVRTDNCQRKGHCTFQLAIQKGTFLATLTMDFAGNLVQVDTGNAPENGVTLETRPDGSYWFYLTTGIRIAARAAYTPSTLQYSMTVVATVGASSRGEVAGLLGDAEGPKNGDLLLPDGTIALFANLQAFIDAWEITQASQDLFQSYPTPIAIPVVTGFTPFDPNSIDYNCSPA